MSTAVTYLFSVGRTVVGGSWTPFSSQRIQGFATGLQKLTPTVTKTKISHNCNPNPTSLNPNPLYRNAGTRTRFQHHSDNRKYFPQPSHLCQYKCYVTVARNTLVHSNI